MHVFGVLLICSAIFVVGFGAGFLFLYQMKRMKSYSGVLNITRTEERVLFSLELLEDPMMLENVEEVIFKVES